MGSTAVKTGHLNLLMVQLKTHSTEHLWCLRFRFSYQTTSSRAEYYMHILVHLWSTVMKLLELSCTHAKQTTKVKKYPARTFSAQQELIYCSRHVQKLIPIHTKIIKQCYLTSLYLYVCFVIYQSIQVVGHQTSYLLWYPLYLIIRSKDVKKKESQPFIFKSHAKISN